MSPKKNEFRAFNFTQWLFTIPVTFILLGLVGEHSLGQDPWLPENRVEFRPHMGKCETYFVPADSGPLKNLPNDGVGIPLVSSNTPTEIIGRLLEIRNERGIEAIRDSVVWIGGVEMKDADIRSREVAEELTRVGLGDVGVRIEVYKIPREWVRKRAETLLGKVFQGMVAAVPRMAAIVPNKQQYQSPRFGESFNGMLALGIVETGCIYYLATSLPTLDAVLTISVHAAILTAYTLWNKWMLNWLFTAGTTGSELFLKQLMLSTPFIINFNVFGNLSEILAFYQANGFQATLAAFPGEFGNFLFVQGLTAVLQTLFYKHVITQSIGGWQVSQLGDERIALARDAAPFVKVPFQYVDAILLVMAANTGHTLFHLGALPVNDGQVMLAGFTVASFAGLNIKNWFPTLPHPLDWTIPVYKRIADVVGRVWRTLVPRREFPTQKN